jgi:hypothetical protein
MSIAAVDLVVLALATHRLTRLVTTDDVTRPLRERVWRTRPPETSRLGYALTCDWCSSVWAASLLVACSTMLPWFGTVLLSLAVSSVAGLIAAHADR